MFAQHHVQFVQYLLIFRIRFDLPNTEDTIRERPGKRQGVGNLNCKTEKKTFFTPVFGFQILPPYSSDSGR